MLSFLEAALCSLLGLSPSGPKNKPAGTTYTAESVLQAKGGARHHRKALYMKYDTRKTGKRKATIKFKTEKKARKSYRKATKKQANFELKNLKRRVKK